MLSFKVYDADTMSGDDFIGAEQIPLPNLQRGYRHVQLRSKHHAPLANATLFIHVAISPFPRSAAANRAEPHLFLAGGSVLTHAPTGAVGLPAVDEPFAFAPVAAVAKRREMLLLRVEQFREAAQLPPAAELRRGGAPGRYGRRRGRMGARAGLLTPVVSQWPTCTAPCTPPAALSSSRYARPGGKEGG